MTLGQMLSALYADLGYPQPSTEQTTRLTRWINEGYRHIMAKPGREQLRDASITITTEANRSLYAWPQAVAKVYAMTQVTNSVRLGFLTKDQYRSLNPGLNQSSGFAYAWSPDGWGPVLRQPEGTGLWAVSSDALDTTQRVNVQGFLTNNDTSAEIQSAVLNGTTRVQIGTLTTWNILERLDLTAVGVGIIRIYDAATLGNELLRLQPGQTSAQYQHFRLFPTPSSAVDYQADISYALTELVNANDIPLLPPDFHDMLPLYARLREAVRGGDSTRTAWNNGEMRERLTELVRYVDFPKDYQPIVGSARSGMGVNNLGAWYPADYVYS